VDRVVRRITAGSGFGAAFIHRIGHGIGIEEHEDPYLLEGNEARLEVGHAFSVEPGIYFPGRFGARIEGMVVVSGDGVLRCNAADRALNVVAV
jgi:Xaa-Pro aminopeptidase